jgi:hypothetical protein
MGIRIFSLEEANTMIPDLSRRLGELKGLVDRIVQEQDGLMVLELIGSKEAGSPEHSEYLEKKRATSALVAEFDGKFRRIQSLGCFVKDINRGLVDFYSVRNGRLIFFCWELGEKEIRFWHELNTGYAGRKPIAELYDT